jgi:hypothetical protein
VKKAGKKYSRGKGKPSAEGAVAAEAIVSVLSVCDDVEVVESEERQRRERREDGGLRRGEVKIGFWRG